MYVGVADTLTSVLCFKCLNTKLSVEILMHVITVGIDVSMSTKMDTCCLTYLSEY